MFKSVTTLKDSLKNKPVAMVQEKDQLIITNTKTNQALFVMKVFNNGTTVNIKQVEFDALQAIPAEKTRTLTLYKLTHKIFRINSCQGKTVIMMNTVDNKVMIKNTINNTEYSADVIDGNVTLNESDYKAIRNPQVIDETGKPVPLKDVIKQNNPNLETKRVKKVVETSRVMPVEALKRKIDRINEINEDVLIVLHNKYKGFMKITNGLVDPVEVFKMEVKEIDNIDCVEIPIEHYKSIRNPQHYDADGKEITLAQYLKSKPKKERKPRVKREKPVVEAKPVKPIVYKTMSIPDDLLIETSPQKICLKCSRINRIEKAEVIKFKYDKENQLITVENTLNNTRYVLRVIEKVVLITKLDMDAIKLPVHRDADGKRIKIADRK